MSIFFTLVIAFLIAIIQGIFFKKFGNRKLKYDRYFNTATCYRGDQVEMVEQISNRKLLPVPWLRLESSIDAGLQFNHQVNLDIKRGETVQNHKSFFSMLPFTKVTRRHKITALKRGAYQLKTVSLTCGDILGVYKSAESKKIDAELIVYPDPLAIDEIPLPSHSWQGDVTVRRWIVEDPFIIQGVREYRFGDSLNTINWKATAKTMELQVQNRDFTADHYVMILLNVEDTETMWQDITDTNRIEYGIRIVSTIIHDSIGRGIDTGFSSNAPPSDATREEANKSLRISPGGGPAHMQELLEMLAKLKIERTIPFETLLDQEIETGQSNKDIVIVSAFVSQKMEDRIENLRRMGNAVKVYELDPEYQEEEEEIIAENEENENQAARKESELHAG